MYNLILKLNPLAIGIVVIIMTILVLNIVISFALKKKYKNLVEDIEDKDNRENKIFEFDLFNSMIKDYGQAQKRNIEDINTISIIEKHMHNHLNKSFLAERFLKKSVSLMIILGLIGTFYGLTLSIGDLVQLLTNASESVVGDVNAITDGLISAVRSMSVAFVTSLFGITSSVIVTILGTVFNIKEYRENLIVSAEEYLDNHLSKTRRRLGSGGAETKSNLEFAFEKFGSVIENNLKEVTSELSYKLTKSSNAMTDSADIIKSSIDKFDKSLDKFNDNVRDFSEFNHHLKTNIERMSVSFDDLTSDLKEQNSKKHMVLLTESIDKLSEKVK